MNQQMHSMLQTWITLSPKLQEKYLFSAKSDFIKFLGECFHNLFEGNIKGLSEANLSSFSATLQKIYAIVNVKTVNDVARFVNPRNIVSELRIILSSKRGRDLLLFLYPFINNVVIVNK